MSNFLFDSRYPVDKIAWLKTGEITTDQYGGFNVNFPHDLGSMLFVKGVWSVDNFATCYPIGTSKRNVGVMVVRSSVVSTNNNVNFSGYVQNTNKIQYRLWGVVDDSSNISVNETASQSLNRFVLDTRTNLPRLTASFYLGAGQTYNHNMGKVPYCDIWVTFNNTEYAILSNDMFGVIYGIGEFCKITERTIQTAANQGSGQPLNYYVRVYD